MRKIGEITVHEVGQPTFEGERSHGQRRPFFFLPKSQVLLLGAPGGDHWNMVSRDPVAKRFQKEVFDDDETAYGGLYRTPGGENVVEFYRGTPDAEHIPAITNALGANRAQLNEWHVGEGVHDNPDKTWHWNFQSRVAKNDEKWQFKMAMPVGEDFWHQWPGDLYHGTSSDRLDSIMRHGLHPWDTDIAGGTNYDNDDWLKPRPGHVYLSQNPQDAHGRAKDASPWIGADGPITLRIDPRYLQPEFINPDEDVMHKHWVAPSNQTGYAHNPSTKGYPSLGEYAEGEGWGNDPAETQLAITKHAPIAYRGIIPPEAIIPGRMSPGMQWEPIVWPKIIARVSVLTILPWKWGQWGKGIYYPETGVLQTWGDDRTHPDVWNDDENYSQPGGAHHIVIRPNGTVHDQGAIDRNYEDVEGDIEGLQQALKELNPRLRLDSSSEWLFGPTEPMEEEPSSVSRGEEGGTINGIQTSNDYAGSL